MPSTSAPPIPVAEVGSNAGPSSSSRAHGRRPARRWTGPVLALALAVGSVAFTVLPSSPASADQISDAQAQATALQAQIQANGTRIDALSQQYDAATYKLQQVSGQIAQTQAQLTGTRHQVDHDQAQLRVEAVHAYVDSGTTNPVTDMFTSTGDTAGIRQAYTDLAAGDVNATISHLHTAQTQLQSQQGTLQQQQAQATATQANIAAASRQANALVAQEQDSLTAAKANVASLVQQQQDAAAQAAAAAFTQKIAAQQAATQPVASQTPTAQAPTQQATTPPPSNGGGNGGGSSSGGSSSGGGGGGGSSSGGGGSSTPPPASPAPAAGGAAEAVAAAQSQLGVPYAWGAESPGVAFDCSGLTMWAWGQAGVSLDHYTGAQYDETAHVPLSDIQPGDLLFYGVDASDHVAMYIGGGMMVEAPYTGAVVWDTPVRTGDDFWGVGRP